MPMQLTRPARRRIRFLAKAGPLATISPSWVGARVAKGNGL